MREKEIANKDQECNSLKIKKGTSVPFFVFVFNFLIIREWR